MQVGVFGLINVTLFDGPVVPVLIGLGVLLIAWDWVKPLVGAVVSKAKGLIHRLGNRVATPTQSTTSQRVALWEELYAACEPCPKARALLDELFQHLAPHSEATK